MSDYRVEVRWAIIPGATHSATARWCVVKPDGSRASDLFIGRTDALNAMSKLIKQEEN